MSQSQIESMLSTSAKNALCVALDTADSSEAERIAKDCSEVAGWFKVGLELFTSEGGLGALAWVSDHGKVFLDLKFKDIPNTVRKAAKVVSDYGGVSAFNVHMDGGLEMMRAAVEGRDQGNSIPEVWGVSILTSENEGDSFDERMGVMIDNAMEAGLEGIICSGLDADKLLQEVPPRLRIITPGIRFPVTDAGDQKRVTTPYEALSNGSDLLVVGRPITQAEYPGDTARQFNKDILKTLRQIAGLVEGEGDSS